MSNDTSTTPVLIVGGGAAGVVLSAELRRRGIACRTIDKMSEPSTATRAFTLHSRTLEMFERMDRELVERYLNRGNKTKGFTFNFQGIDERPVLDFTDLDTCYPHVLVHNQDETEQFVREYMHDKLDYEIEWNTRLVDIEQHDKGVRARLLHEDDDDREEIVDARWLVACDGIHSSIRKSIGLDYKGSDYTGMVLQNMDVTLDGFPDGHDWIHFYMAKDHFLLVVRLPGDNYRLLISDMGEAADPDLSPRQAFQKLVDQHFDGVTLGEPHWATQWQIWTRLAGTYRDRNIFLAGDCAHVHSPSGGQGMNCCMQDANNLAWKLALVIQGRASPALLDSYEAERKPVAEQVIAGASALHEIMMAHGTGVEERIKLTKDPEWLAVAAGRVSGIAYTYRDYVEKYDGLQAIEGPVIGDRVPDVEFSEDTNLFSLFCHPDMNLLLLPVSGLASDRQLCDDISRYLTGRYAGIIRVFTIVDKDSGEQQADLYHDNSSKLKQYYGQSDEGRLYFVRPDGYIGFRCLFSEVDIFYAYLQSFLISQ